MKVEFDIPDEVFVVSGVACLRGYDSDRNNNMVFVRRLDDDTLPTDASEMGLIIHDYYHSKIMRNLEDV